MTDPIGASISAIVVSYKTGPALWPCLYRLLQQQGVGEVIVVDNGNDGEVSHHLQEITKSYPRLKYYQTGENLGFSRGVNYGVDRSSGKYLAIVNPDAVILEYDGLYRLANLLHEGAQATPPIWMTGGVLRSEDGREQRASRRAIMTPGNAISESLFMHKLFPKSFPALNIHHMPLPDRPARVPAVSGACMVMERERYDAIGRLDEKFFLHMEDMDLCYRIHQEGGAVWIHPHVNILHYRSTSRATTLFVERHKTAGFCRYFGKHFHDQKVAAITAHVAAKLRFYLKIVTSFFGELQPVQVLKTPRGLKQIQAILRGSKAAYAEGLAAQGAGTAVMVTGASTAVGLFTVGRLLAMGCKVVAVCRKSQVGYFHPNLIWVHAELEHVEGLYGVLQNHPCHFLIHAAPIWYLPPLLQTARQLGVEYIAAIGSSSLLGKEETSDRKEQKVVQKLAEAETALANGCAQLQMGWTIIRPTMIYGAGLDGNISLIARILDRFKLFPIQPPAKGKRAPVHADDVAKTAIKSLAVEEAQAKTYFLNGGSEMEYHELPGMVAGAMGIKGWAARVPLLSMILSVCNLLAIGKLPTPEIARRMQQDLVFPDERVTTELNIQPRPFLEDGVLDLGEASEEICQSLLPALPDS